MSGDRASELLAGTGGADEAQLAGLIGEINRVTGVGFELVGAAEHGGSRGAAYVRWPDGREAVVTRTPAPLARMRQTADVLAIAASRGLPVPRHDRVLELADGTVAVIQQRLPGRPPRRVDAPVIDAMVAVNDRFAHLLADRPDVPTPPLYLRRSGPLYPRQEVLENYNDRSRRLLARIRAIGDADPREMTGEDLLHPDYTLGNVLQEPHGNVSAVVDWNWGAGRGDRHFALVRIYVDLYWSTLYDGGQYGVEQSAFDRLDQVLTERVEPATLQRYWAHLTLNQLHWAIQYHPHQVVDLFLRVGESRLL